MKFDTFYTACLTAFLGIMLVMIIRSCQAKYIYQDMRCVFAECRIEK